MCIRDRVKGKFTDAKDAVFGFFKRDKKDKIDAPSLISDPDIRALQGQGSTLTAQRLRDSDRTISQQSAGFAASISAPVISSTNTNTRVSTSANYLGTSPSPMNRVDPHATGLG